MLSPNVNNVIDSLAQSYSTIARVDGFAFASMNTMIGKLSPDPDWLGPMRQELSLLSAAGARWQQQKPQIWTPLLTAFPNYATLFAGFADASAELGNDRDAWLSVLQTLSEALVRHKLAAKAAEQQFTLQVQNLSNVEAVFSSSLNKAWAALADEEQQMIDLASQVTALQDRLGQLEADLSGDAISSGKSFIQSSVTISYTLVSTAGASIPYLSIAGLLFTTGKLAYDLIVTDKAIGQTIDQIVALRIAMSQEAQAAAMSKAVIHLINSFDKQLLAVGHQLPALSTMWGAENDKVQEAIHALQAGAVPRQMFELISMPSAAASWQTLADFVPKLMLMPEAGTPVLITTSEADPIQAPLSNRRANA